MRALATACRGRVPHRPMWTEGAPCGTGRAPGRDVWQPSGPPRTNGNLPRSRWALWASARGEHSVVLALRCRVDDGGRGSWAGGRRARLVTGPSAACARWPCGSVATSLASIGMAGRGIPFGPEAAWPRRFPLAIRPGFLGGLAATRAGGTDDLTSRRSVQFSTVRGTPARRGHAQPGAHLHAFRRRWCRPDRGGWAAHRLPHPHRPGRATPSARSYPALRRSSAHQWP